MPQPVDDDSTIRVTNPVPPGAHPVPRGANPVSRGMKSTAPPGAPGVKPASPGVHPAATGTKPFSPGVKPILAGAMLWRLPVWAIAAPIMLVVLAACGWLLWPSAPPPIAVRQLPAVERSTTAPIPPPPDAAVPRVAVTAPTAGPVAEPVPGVTPASAAARIPPEAVHPAPPQPEFTIETATEQQILDHVPSTGAPDPMVFRFKPNPRILVLDFASLLDQGRMLNRVAALVEKSGLPHDRLLTEPELDAAIRAGGDTVETFYYGHDYGAASLIRFFALADRDNIRLLGDEDRLGRLIRQAGWFEPDAHAALISIRGLAPTNTSPVPPVPPFCTMNCRTASISPTRPTSRSCIGSGSRR